MCIPVVSLLSFACHALSDGQVYSMGSPPYGLGFWVNLAQTGTNGISLGIPPSNTNTIPANLNGNSMGLNANPNGNSAGPNEAMSIFPTIQYGTAFYRPGVCNLNVS